MAKGGGTQTQNVTQTQALPAYAQPYYQDVMSRAQGLVNKPYIPYGYTQNETGAVVRATDPVTGQPVSTQRIADFTPEQVQTQKDVLGLQTPAQFGNASQISEMAGLSALGAGQYTPGQFGVAPVQAQQVNAPTMQSAQTGYRPDLQYFQMAAPQQFGGRQATQYMSPFIQQALEPQMREAVLSAKRGQLAQDLGAARQGVYGGSRQLLASMERERNLGQQMGDIYGRGMQTAYENAQSQFERDRAAQMQAGQTNLQAALGVQGLGAQYGTQVALANLSNEQQARVNNQALQFQAMGMNAENALKAALANQQSGMEAQRMGEASRQFGAQQGLAALQQANQSAQTLGNLGQMQGQADLSRLGMQQSTAAQAQALNQQYLDTLYQDFVNQTRTYPMQQLQAYSGLLNNTPVGQSTSTTTTAPSPSVASQIIGSGLGALGMYKTITG